MITQNHRKEPNFYLRNYQLELLNKYYQSYSKGFRKPLIQAPTGSGKSILMMAIIKDFINSKKPIILVAHKEELINQLQTHIIQNFGIEPTIIADSSRYTYNPENPICVASIQGWASRLKRSYELPQKPEIVIIDEAHHVSSPIYSKFIEYYHHSHIVGFTATPYRIDGRGFKYLDNGIEGFDILIKGPAVIDLINQGHLSDIKIYGAVKKIGSDFKVVMGEFSQKQQVEAIKVQINPHEVVEEWKRLAYGKKTILYPISVEISKEYCDAFNDHGIPTAHIDSNTSHKERKQILTNFKQGNILVLCQHSIVIEGVDVPDVECVQFVRATNSLNLWWQAIGRGMRPHPNKKHLIVIDHSNNHERLPLITTPIEFFLAPNPIDEEAIGVTKCPYCDHTFQKNSTDQSKFKELKDLSELEIAMFSFKYDLTETEEKATIGNKFLKGFYIDLNCPSCNQVFSHPKYEEKQALIATGISNSYDQDFNDRADEIADDEGNIEQIEPRNKEEIFYKIKKICQQGLSKTMKLVLLDLELGIKNLDDEEIKLFINDSQAKPGWFYYIKTGQATKTKYYQTCYKMAIKEMINKKHKEKEEVKNVFDLMLEKN